MGVTDISEVLNYLLLDIKGLGYTFGIKPTSQPQPQRQTSIGYAFDPSTFEPAFAPIPDADRNQEIDPVICRLANLIEEF